jgi:N-acetylneuraminic acid mutarotase
MQRITTRTAASVLIVLLASASAFAQETWSPLATAPRAFARHGMVEAGGLIYCFGGVDPTTGATVADAWTFDAGTGTWSAIASLPAAVHSMGAAESGGLIYCVGGVDETGSATAAVQAYDPSTDQWTQAPPLPFARGGLVAVGALGGVVAIGGYGVGGAVLNECTVLLAGAVAWTPRGALPEPRRGGYAGLAAGQLIYAGGLDPTGTASKDTFRYVVEDWAWTHVSPMPAPDSDGGSATVNGRLYCLGGINATPEAPTLREYDAVLDQWSFRLPPTARIDGGRAVASGDGLIVLGSLAGGDVPMEYAGVNFGAAPAVPAGLDQEDSATNAELPIGGLLEGRLILWATVTDSDSGQVRLEAEVRGAGESFRNWPNVRGEFTAPTSLCASMPRPGNGSYRWQVRAVDDNGNASPWIAFTTAGVTDFRVETLVIVPVVVHPEPPVLLEPYEASPAGTSRDRASCSAGTAPSGGLAALAAAMVLGALAMAGIKVR